MRRPIVMLHGAFCGAWAFQPFADFFRAAGYECHAQDLPFHGARWTPAHASELAKMSLLDYFDDIKSLIKSIDEPPVVFGHSMGGLLAQKLAADDLISGAVLLAPSSPWGVMPASANEFVSAQGLLWLMGDYWNGVLDPQFDIAAKQALDQLPRELQSQVFSKFTPESGLATFEIMHWLFDHRRASAVNAHDVKIPMLFIAGARDRVNHPDTVRRTARRYRSNADFLTAHGHSHWLVGEPGWESIAKTSLNWMISKGL